MRGVTVGTEEWRDVPGYEGRYAVSTFGRVYSYVSDKMLKPGPRPSGHMTVVLHRGSGKGDTKDVHTLVLTAFVGPRPTGNFDARHLNGAPYDNALSNLEWSTRTRNRQDMKHHNGAKGQKLRPDDVLEIRKLLSECVPYRIIAVMYGVSFGLIGAIKRGKSHDDVR